VTVNRDPVSGLAVSDDHLLYSRDGRVIGYHCGENDFFVANEHVTYADGFLISKKSSRKVHQVLAESSPEVVSEVVVFPKDNAKAQVTTGDIVVHNLNVRFALSRPIQRTWLWRKLIALGYNARFDPTVHVGVNVRYRYLESIASCVNKGICACPTRLNMICDRCGLTSILCFPSGKVVLTGLTRREDAVFLAEFLVDLLNRLHAEDALSPQGSTTTPAC
jgi:hypothetical protein